MPDWLSVHKPIIVNTIGHSAGVVIFGILLYLFLVNWRRAREERSILPAVAAALAMLWNLGSLIALASGPSSGPVADVIVAGSFSVLSVLPAVLLHISLGSDYPPLWMGGYVLSTIAVALHAGDLVTGAARFHYAALILVTAGFACLTIISVLLELRQKNRAASSRLAGAMGLFLFAISFAHFGSEHARQAWSGEIAFHHAGIPLALLVLLQDYRFLLLDTFLRFVVNASLAAAAVLISIPLIRSPEITEHLKHPFDAGLLFVSACLLLTIFVYARNRMQGLLTRVIFLRSNVDDALRELQQLGRAAASESAYLNHSSETVAHFLHAARFKMVEKCPSMSGHAIPLAVLDPLSWSLPGWAQAVVPLHFSRGDARYLLLGPRDGGRRYLSEDFAVLARLEAAVVEQVEQLRGVQMQNLVSEAELKALQAQINPHFLFNSLNTLYGTIDRSNAEARRLVLNLADVFRYLLRSDRTFIEIEEELKIVRAYLEIEELRLGTKLRTELDVDESVLRATIPLLSIQPLVENAVKHGVASKAGRGFVRLSIRQEPGGVAVSISNSGECDPAILATSDGGVGLANVRRRLALCYGAQTRIEAKAIDGVTTVGFLLPRTRVPGLAVAAARV
ncbi:MAG TPA: histidine kinase [Bryobacteraceae bacterium]|jgi:two-component system LytT family sensor kinase|nr:histidine kinase [Bryobacteraceae bacterium]